MLPAVMTAAQPPVATGALAAPVAYAHAPGELTVTAERVDGPAWNPLVPEAVDSKSAFGATAPRHPGGWLEARDRHGCGLRRAAALCH